MELEERDAESEDEVEVSLEEEPKHEHKARKEPAVVKMPRWLLVTFLVLLFAGTGVLAVWKLGVYAKLHARYEQGDVIIKLKDADSLPIADASIVLNSTTYHTDSTGRASLTKVPAGTYTVSVTAAGFQPLTPTLSLHRKTNPLTVYSLVKQVAPLYAVKGFVQDYVSGKALVNAQVTLGQQTASTDPSGGYAFTGLAAGDEKVAIAKDGYQSQTLNLTITNADVVTAKIPLVPNGQSIFVSNRDGKRAIYTAAFDGSGQKRLIDPLTGEDFGSSVSPDNGMVAFSSTRDQVKDSSGNTLAKLYVAKSDGTGIKKVADAVATTFTPIWSANSQRLFYSGFTDATFAQSVYAVYSVKDGSSLVIGETASNITFSPDGNTVAYTTIISTPASTDAPYTYMLKSINLLSGQRTTLASRTQALSEVRFSADGTAVSYQVQVSGATHRYSDVIASTTESEVALLAANNRKYVISPDGTHMAFVDVRDGQSDLYMVDRSEANEVRLTTLGFADSQVAPHWDNSSQYLTFGVLRQGENAIYIVSVAGGDPKKIADYYLDH